MLKSKAYSLSVVILLLTCSRKLKEDAAYPISLSTFKVASCIKLLPKHLHPLVITDNGRWFDGLNLIQDINFVLAYFEVKAHLPHCH